MRFASITWDPRSHNIWPTGPKGWPINKTKQLIFLTPTKVGGKIPHSCQEHGETIASIVHTKLDSNSSEVTSHTHVVLLYCHSKMDGLGRRASASLPTES